MLTDEDIADLQATTCEKEWSAVCDRIKAANGDRYPSDWFARVNKSGMMDRIFRSWEKKSVQN